MSSLNISSSPITSLNSIVTRSRQMELLTTGANALSTTINNRSDKASALSSFFWGISWLLGKVLAGLFYYVPATILSVFSLRVQFRVPFSFVVLLVLLALLFIYAYVRYRYLTKYSRLPEEPKRQQPTLDTFLEGPTDEARDSRLSYLDEFLKAIKIFGYLDKPVFHELTKSMQTQKLDSGEILFLDDSSGFTICVEGEVQVYFQIGEEKDSNHDIFARNSDKDVVVVDGVKYKLLNNIKSGAPLSSFISILSLLSDSSPVALPYAAPTPSGFSFAKPRQSLQVPQVPASMSQGSQGIPAPQAAHSPTVAQVPQIPHDGFSLDDPSASVSISLRARRSSAGLTGPAARNIHQSINRLAASRREISGASIVHSPPNASPTAATVTPGRNPSFVYENPSPEDSFEQTPSGNSSTSEVKLIAIPKGDSSISIIPRESFARLAKKYPKATMHIIELILTKLYRVTFQTASDYLEMTSDIFQTEVNLNNSHFQVIPDEMRRHVMDSLDAMAEAEGSTEGNNDGDLGRSPSPMSKSSNPAIVVRSSRHMQNSNRDGTMSMSPNFPPVGSRRMMPRRRTVDRGMERSNTLGVAISVSPHTPAPALLSPRLPSSGRSVTELSLPGSTGDLTRGRSHSQSLRWIMEASGEEEDNVGDDPELINTLADNICALVGIERDMFNSHDNPNSVTSSRFSGQLVTGLTPVNVVPAVEEHYHFGRKLRTFSTAYPLPGDSFDDTSVVSTSAESGVAEYENVRKDLGDEIQIVRIPQGARIIKSEEQTPGIYYVIEGALDVTFWKRQLDDLDSRPANLRSLHSEENKGHNSKMVEQYLYTAHNNQLVGYLGTLIGSRSLVDVRASATTYAAFVPRNVFDIMTERYPRVESCVARRLLGVLDRRLYLTDYALEWVHAYAGNPLYRQDEPANGIYIVLNGRFRSIQQDKASGKHKVLAEHGQGESLGEVEVLTKTRRRVTLVAIRDSELARIPRTLFEMIALTNPSIMVNLSRIVANRITESLVENGGSFQRHTSVGASGSGVTMASISPHIKDEPLLNTFTDFRTFTVLPTMQGLPVMEFGERLALALESTGKSVKMLNQSSALTSLGKHAFDRLAKLKQSGYFAELEEKYDIVMYLVDTLANSSWTRTCIQQGDCILLLADASASPDVGDYERTLLKTKTTARTELVLLHPERSVEPGLTNRWLKNRVWVHAHHHIQMQSRHPASPGDTAPIVMREVSALERMPGLLSRSTARLRHNLKSRVENIITRNDLLIRLTRDSIRSKKYYQPMQAHKDDFMRLARILTGQSIGLVLGGGGARGFSHIGVIKALEDNGIPVDIIGGTSIGAFVGGLYAKDYDFVPVYGRAKTFAGRMSSMWRSLLDLTIPITSYITGHEFNRGIWKAFRESRIEDFWIKYYANSTNITESLMEVHTSGYAWRYIRASMSLASLLPPLTDNGNMLLDGGYVDNLTVEEMKRRGAKVIIAVDVGSVDDRSPMSYGDTLSGFWVLWNRLNPFSTHPNVPTMADIQMRLGYVASVNALDRAKDTDECIYLRPPIEGYATLDFAKYDEIYRVGLNYGSKVVRKLKESDKLSILRQKKKEEVALPGHGLRRRYSI